MREIFNEKKNMKRDTLFAGIWFSLDAIIERILPNHSADFEQGFYIILLACFIIIIEGFIMHDIQKEISLSSCYSSIASGVIVLGAAIIDMVMGKTFVFVEGLLLSAIVIGVAIKDIIEFHE